MTPRPDPTAPTRRTLAAAAALALGLLTAVAAADEPASASAAAPAPVAIPAPAPAPLPDPEYPPPVVASEPKAPSPATVRYQPVNVGFMYPIATNAGAPDIFTHLDLALVLGRIGYLGGLQIGPVGWVGYDMRGAQIGLAHVVEGRAEGLELDGLFSIARGDFAGAQIAGLMGWTSGRMTGLALAGMASYVYADVDGVLLGGLVSVARGKVRGLQMAGGTNIGRVDGLQLGIVNVSAEVRGVQIGLINVARRIKGVQVGVLNITDKLEGESLGLLPIPRRGGVHPVVWGSNSIFANLGVKFASAYAYSILGIGLHNRPLPDGKRQAAFTAGLTLGARVPITEGFAVAGDLAGNRLFADGVPLTTHDELYKARVLVSFEIAKRLVPFVGGGVAMAVQGSDSLRFSFLPEGTAGIEL
ncbi:LA_2272 family surface repeat-containing protein [Polyangium mundeleinium]|uniref:Uncharacterized protein n=1 Tax=Polyangium mundeleinium TaxID=2995306 RepID=A0ABT5ETD3_9BACT|nr:hypothetical protein [Polyangium mundeleinium]MDC0745080.1 hypothetical protein [Polyangium mundeleinium]